MALITASQYAQKNQNMIYYPLFNNLAHYLIQGYKTDSTRKQLAKLAVRV